MLPYQIVSPQLSKNFLDTLLVDKGQLVQWDAVNGEELGLATEEMIAWELYGAPSFDDLTRIVGEIKNTLSFVFSGITKGTTNPVEFSPSLSREPVK